MLEIGPICKSLWRSKVGPLLIILQLALSTAIVSNALFFVEQRLEKMSRPTGFAHSELSKISFKQRAGGAAIGEAVQRDLQALEAIPGLKGAAPIEGVPFAGYGSRWSISDQLDGAPDARSGAFGIMFADHRTVDVLGVQLVAGRSFHAEEILYSEPGQPPPPNSVSILLSEASANFLFPNQTAVGQTAYLAGAIPVTVAGVFKDILAYNPSAEKPHHNAIVSAMADEGRMDYVIRSDAADRQEVLAQVMRSLKEVDSSRIVDNEKTIEALMEAHYGPDRAMMILLSAVVSLLVFINMLGIIGITTFWVNQRRKQIGVRRALGATQAAIVRYFLLENAILVTVAAGAGAAIAFLVNGYLVRHYAIEFLPWGYTVLTGVLVLAVTLTAAAVPARLAATISPKEAVAG